MTGKLATTGLFTLLLGTAAGCSHGSNYLEPVEHHVRSVRRSPTRIGPQTPYDVPHLPPAAYAEDPIAAAPFDGAVWVAGCWELVEAEWVWVDGYWTTPPYGHVWVVPVYEATGANCVYTPGFWADRRPPRRRPAYRRGRPANSPATVIVQGAPSRQPRPAARRAKRRRPRVSLSRETAPSTSRQPSPRIVGETAPVLKPRMNQRPAAPSATLRRRPTPKVRTINPPTQRVLEHRPMRALAPSNARVRAPVRVERRRIAPTPTTRRTVQPRPIPQYRTPTPRAPTYRAPTYRASTPRQAPKFRAPARAVTPQRIVPRSTVRKSSTVTRDNKNNNNNQRVAPVRRSVRVKKGR